MNDPLSSAPLPPRAQAAVEAYLLGEGWTYDVVHHRGCWTTLSPIRSGEEWIYFEYLAFVAHDRVVLYVSRETKATPTATRETLELLNWLNGSMHCVSYGLSHKDREVRLRVSLAGDLGAVIDAETIGTMTALALTQEERYSPVIRDVAEGRSTARQAIDAILMAQEQLTLGLTT